MDARIFIIAPEDCLNYISHWVPILIIKTSIISFPHHQFYTLLDYLRSKIKLINPYKYAVFQTIVPNPLYFAMNLLLFACLLFSSCWLRNKRCRLKYDKYLFIFWEKCLPYYNHIFLKTEITIKITETCRMNEVRTSYRVLFHSIFRTKSILWS